MRAEGGAQPAYGSIHRLMSEAAVYTIFSTITGFIDNIEYPEPVQKSLLLHRLRSFSG
jgi:hypothetical protein